MAYPYEYPYTDPNRHNDDWAINKIKLLEDEMSNFIITHVIKFADPIEWNPQKYYAIYTIVLDSDTKDTYLAKRNVPAGIPLSDGRYWYKIGYFDAQLEAYHREYLELESRAQSAFDTLADLLDADLEVGRIARTGGYNTIGDKGGGLYRIYNARVSPLDVEHNNKYYHLIDTVYNIRCYGAGVENADNATIINNIISNMSVGDTLYIPTGTYRINDTIVVNKQIHIIGESAHRGNVGVDEYGGSIIDYRGDASAIRIGNNGVFLENLNIINLGGRVTDSIGVYLHNERDEKVLWDLTLTNVKCTNFNFGVSGSGVLLSTFNQVHCDNCKQGIRLDSTREINTSLVFNNCWTRNCTTGYDLSTIYYSTFNSCASDDNTICYYLDNINGVTFNSCGAELASDSAFYCNNTNVNAVLNACFITSSKRGITTWNAQQRLTIINLQMADTGEYSIYSNGESEINLITPVVDKIMYYNGTTGVPRNTFVSQSPIA